MSEALKQSENDGAGHTRGRMEVDASAVYILEPEPNPNPGNRICANVQKGGAIFGDMAAECASNARRLAACWNALSPLTVEAIEKIQPMDFAHWKVLTARVAEFERALREIQGMATNAGYDSCNSAIYAVADKALHDPTSAALAAVPAANAEEGE